MKCIMYNRFVFASFLKKKKLQITCSMWYMYVCTSVHVQVEEYNRASSSVCAKPIYHHPLRFLPLRCTRGSVVPVCNSTIWILLFNPIFCPSMLFFKSDQQFIYTSQS